MAERLRLLSETLRTKYKNPAIWVGLAIMVGLIAFSRNGAPDRHADIQALRGIVETADLAFGVLELPTASSDERSRAFAAMEKAATAAIALQPKDSCLQEAIGYISGFLNAMRVSVLDSRSLAEVHRTFRETSRRKIDHCET